MPLLLTVAALEERRAIAAGTLAPLARSLAEELEPLLHVELFIPQEKARLTRTGGRCPHDGLLLDFDPWSPHEHTCPRCGTVEGATEHYRMWIMWYQLWLAERAARAATLYALAGDPRHATLARNVLERYADGYVRYPNVDNVLGPTGPFFSTYLESIWLLQLCVALDLLESAGASVAGAHVRRHLVEPSARLIASYDEGGSNRQVWNGAALLAAARVLGDDALAERTIRCRSGLLWQLEHGLLGDGAWYEGENYHLFAHRGLWYAIQIAETSGVALPPELRRRFEEGFATPFAVALPDLSLPARRDSQYGISLRQWRFAELCELGLARRVDPRLTSMLAELYDPDVPVGGTGRDRSTAEAERNSPPARLTRADLGWRSLLHARAELPPLERTSPKTVLLEAQGVAVLRRDAGMTYAALDYGESGGGHGHPDRLSLMLARGPVHWLDDPGTGSYVDPSLHWYRSTLAHNAPLVDGRSQRRAAGRLLAFEERGAAGWVEAAATDIAPGAALVRTLVLMPDYLLDLTWWDSAAMAQVDLPWHIDAELLGVAEWRSTALPGGNGLEDGFSFLTETEQAHTGSGVAVRLRAERDGESLLGWVDAPGAEWWRALAPGKPGAERTCFLLTRSRGRTGRVAAVWSWSEAVRSVAFDGEFVSVVMADGQRHRHSRVEHGWHIDLFVAAASSSIDLGGVRAPAVVTATLSAEPSFEAVPALTVPVVHEMTLERAMRLVTDERTGTRGSGGVECAEQRASAALRLSLGESHYRRSELSWRDAGAPLAEVGIVASPCDVFVCVRVRKEQLHFVPARAINTLDNEHPDVNSDGVQLHVRPHAAGVPGEPAAWTLVPELGGQVRVRAVTGSAAGTVPRARWQPCPDGYALCCSLSRAWLTGDADVFELDLLVNLMRTGRERREGQLVLSGGRSEYVYLRGDRQPAERLLPVILRHA